MQALDLLTSRRSEKKLFEPAPSKDQLEKMFQAALHTPDHGKLQPYHFVVIEQDRLAYLADLLKEAVNELNLGEERLKKAESFATRAPMIIGVVAKINKDIKKVPAWEQMLTAGCATYALQLAANAQGFANVWVTGPWIDGSALRQAFGCEQHDKIVALVMIGTEEEKISRDPKVINTENIVRYL
ncbi:NAD(P)H nitroreductase [Conservatibacter flavescens]|uniref:Putative NAD(P)H nitroreductase n=1 Tax=Conservatibacter flavescens TaxID=28161 RepID=A0A2M8S662_9PAST|nr:NAD(P)H nitroreductase [Conservatibacter flavescens]PJG86618.1 NAD(P)H nitroreductase [Conservatibacter flavescens]